MQVTEVISTIAALAFISVLMLYFVRLIKPGMDAERRCKEAETRYYEAATKDIEKWSDVE